MSEWAKRERRTESLDEERELPGVRDELVDLSARVHACVLDACDTYRSHGSCGEQRLVTGDNRRCGEQRTKGWGPGRVVSHTSVDAPGEDAIGGDMLAATGCASRVSH